MPERIRTRADAERAKAQNLPLVVVDVPEKVAQLHLRASRCARVTVALFDKTDERTGSWWTVESATEALERWGAMLEPCQFCTGAGGLPRLEQQATELQPSTGWALGVTAPAWLAQTPDAPTSRQGGEFFASAVPGLDGRASGPLPRPAVVVARVVQDGPPAPVVIGRPLLDALHDVRRSGPFHHEFARRSPLADDVPSEVRGFGVEIHAGETTSTEYLIGEDLAVDASPLATLDVDTGGNGAPSDVRESASPEHTHYAEAVVRAFGRAPAEVEQDVELVVVRHRPRDGRREDDTWRTWLGALTGLTRGGAMAWRGRSPFARATPRGFASIVDPELPVDVRYELYG